MCWAVRLGSASRWRHFVVLLLSFLGWKSFLFLVSSAFLLFSRAAKPNSDPAFICLYAFCYCVNGKWVLRGIKLYSVTISLLACLTRTVLCLYLVFACFYSGFSGTKRTLSRETAIKQGHKMVKWKTNKPDDFCCHWKVFRSLWAVWKSKNHPLVVV